jgi:thiol-disulfide isomerase/thioredoxin
MQIRYVLGALAIVVLTLSGCSGQPTPAPTSTTTNTTEVTASATATPSESISETEAMTGSMAMAESLEMTETMEMTESTSAVERPSWQLLPLTNAQTGESFTLADFAGKTVFVEPFATWCTNCRQQLTYVNEVRANFGEDVVFIALSVEPNIGNEALAQYASEQGFDLLFAAMSPDLLRELVALHGQTITNPPATPHFIIRADGSTTELTTGIESPEAITSLIQSAQS